MKWTMAVELEGAGSVDSVMRTWTDVASWPTWDPRESGSALDGPFAPGTSGRSAQDGHMNEFNVVSVGSDTWTNRCDLPGGALTMDHTVSDLGAGRVSVMKTYTATGPLVPLFALWFGRGIRKDVPPTLAALLAEAARRPESEGSLPTTAEAKKSL